MSSHLTLSMNGSFAHNSMVLGALHKAGFLSKHIREAIAKNDLAAYIYARYVIQAPFPAGEPAIVSCPHLCYSYATMVLRLPPFKAHHWRENYLSKSKEA